MFLGRYEHTLDDKGRLIIPVRYRSLLQGGAYITQGFDKNLMVLTSSDFDQIYQSINQYSMTDPVARQLRRLLFSNADRLEFDKSGRILIPIHLRQAVQLEDTAVIVGMGRHFEIWSKTLWLEYTEKSDNSEANSQHFAAIDLSLR